jgi:hypothetical protein
MYGSLYGSVLRPLKYRQNRQAEPGQQHSLWNTRPDILFPFWVGNATRVRQGPEDKGSAFVSWSARSKLPLVNHDWFTADGIDDGGIDQASVGLSSGLFLQLRPGFRPLLCLDSGQFI